VKENLHSGLSEKVKEQYKSLETLAVKLVQMPTVTPPSDTREIAKFVGNWLGVTEGVKVSYHSAKEPIVNVVARVTGRGPGRRLLLNGHLDTFPVTSEELWTNGPFDGAVQDGKIFGCGISDMKAGCAGLMIVFMLIAGCKDQWSGELVLTLVGDEEAGGILGTRYLLEQVPDIIPDACITADIGGSRVLRFGEKGRFRFELMAKGKSAHGAHVHKGVNAIDRLIDGILRIKEAICNVSPQPPQCVSDAISSAKSLSESFEGAGETTALTATSVTVGMIKGGIAPNLIPDYASAGIDIRFPVGITVDQARRAVEDVVNSSEGLSYRLIAKVSALWTDPNEEIITTTLKNSDNVWGLPGAVNMRLGGTDAKHTREWKIPTVNCGVVGANMGGPNEYAEIHDLQKVTEIITLSAFDYLRAEPYRKDSGHGVKQR
jgi:succinyl-diaminopimelate desuccinylase